MEHYLSRHALQNPLVPDAPRTDLALIVVIPVFNEDHLVLTLEDLLRCDPLQGSVEVIIVINHAETTGEEIKAVNMRVASEIRNWILEHDRPEFRFFVHEAFDLPAKKAGVGLARKTGMDEAARRFAQLRNPSGVIVCLDADCRVDRNYLQEIARCFIENAGMEGCSIYFEHPLDDPDPAIRRAIIDYELHLRYFIGIQRRAGFPFAYQTVGSAMAVRAGVYCRVGGMNTRQAGEDFYFLHKVIERGAFGELNTTVVRPSPRISDRVPFGTGRSVMTQVRDGEVLTTYHPQTFSDLQGFIHIVPLLYNATERNVEFLLWHYVELSIREFVTANGFQQKIAEINAHTASPDAFVKRVFRWFNAFMLMKYVHFARDRYDPNVPVGDACLELLRLRGADPDVHGGSVGILHILREYDRHRQ